MSKLKKLAFLAVAAFIVVHTALAAVTPIADTVYNSRNITNSNASGSDDNRHTSTFEEEVRPSCKAVTIPYTENDSVTLNLCATALGEDSGRVVAEACGDGSKANCTYKEVCTGASGTAAAISGTNSAAISQSIQNILARYQNTGNNEGVVAARCTRDNLPYLYIKCDSSYSSAAEPTCENGQKAYSCSLNQGNPLWKCDYPLCTSAQLDKTVGDDLNESSPLLNGTVVSGYCYEQMTDGNRKLRAIYECDAEIYQYTAVSCSAQGEGLSAASGSEGNCVWNGAYRSGQNTLFNQDQTLYASCLMTCPAGIDSNQESCSNPNNILRQCVYSGSAGSKTILNFCACPLDGEGHEQFYAADECGGKIAGGPACTSAKDLSPRYQYCLPKCSASKTTLGSPSACLEKFTEDNRASGFTKLPEISSGRSEYCADADGKRLSSCSVAKKCCAFDDNAFLSSDTACAKEFIALETPGACSKVLGGRADTNVCLKKTGAETASWQCSCPNIAGIVEGSCPENQSLFGFCTFDSQAKNICAAACSPEDIAAGKVKQDLVGCKIRAEDNPQAELCFMNNDNLRFRCSCPEGYNLCQDNKGAGEACTFDNGEKYPACMLNRSSIICDVNRKLFDDPASCQTTGGSQLNFIQCYLDGNVKYMCECPASYAVCSEGQSGAGDRCTVYDGTAVYYETCGTSCRVNTVERPVVDAPEECPAVNGDSAQTTQCVSGGTVKYECKCPTGYTTKTSAASIGVGDPCTFDGDTKYKEYKEGCPTDRPLFYHEEDCAFDGVKGINVTQCYVDGEASDENIRYFCNCPSTYVTDAKCQGTGSAKEGAGLICPLETSSEDISKVKFQYCLNLCSALPSKTDSNGVIMEDSIEDTRACQWELGQGASYEQCSKNHSIQNKCYCGSDFSSRLTCSAEDNLSPLIDATHSSCMIDGITYYQACKPRKCSEGAILAASQSGCAALLGNAATATKCYKDDDTADYYECKCDTSFFSESCKYPSVEPADGKYCYSRRYDAASNPNPVKQFQAGSCKIGSLDTCYQNGQGPSGYVVTVTSSESECHRVLGDGAEARLCEDADDPDIRRYNCSFNAGDYKWNNSNCPVRHTLGGGSVVINGVRYYKECNCHPAYQYHRFNCAGILSGGGCEQDVTTENNDGTIPSATTKLKFYPYCACSEDYTQVCDGERNVGVGEPCNGKYKACECKPDEMPENWVDNYYGCPGGKRPTGVTKPNGCGGKFYQCEVNQCSWEHTEQCKGDYQIGVDACQDNQGNVAAYKSCKCPDGWMACSGSQVGDGKPCSLNGVNYYKSCKNQNECTNGEYQTCTGELQVGVNPCTKNDKIYFESCTCASGYNKVCTNGETGVGSACVIDGTSYYASCTTPSATCTDKHQDACADNQEKYDPCLTAEGKMKYKCRCPSNYTACTGASGAEGASVCRDSDRGTVYSACTAEETCTVSEEKIYKTCSDQQIGLGRNCTSEDGSIKYSDCQEVNDCKANGYKYVCSGYQSASLGTDFCVDDKGSKLYKECKCPMTSITCNANNTKGTPCTPLFADGTSGETVYSSCTCDESVYKYTCIKEEEGNVGVTVGTDKSCTPRVYDSSSAAGTDGTTVYKSCACEKGYVFDCAGNGVIKNNQNYCEPYKGSRKYYTSCACDTNTYNLTCSNESNPGLQPPSEASAKCVPQLEGGTSGTPVYSKCACGSAYTLTCTDSGQVKSTTDYCTNRDSSGNVTTLYSYCNCSDEYKYTCEGSTAPEPTAAGVCQAVIYEGGTHKNVKYYKSCSCTEGGLYDTEQENMKCTQEAYEGRSCYNCVTPPCSEGGYDTSEKEGYLCTAVTYFGQQCYSCKTDPCYGLEDVTEDCDFGCKNHYSECPSKCKTCGECDDSCPDATYIKSPCTGSQTTIASVQNECKNTCYKCEDKTCGTCGYATFCPTDHNCQSVNCGDATCVIDNGPKSCEERGLLSSCDSTYYICRSVSGCYEKVRERTCEDGNHFSTCAPTSSYTCSTPFIYAGKTCYDIVPVEEEEPTA